MTTNMPQQQQQIAVLDREEERRRELQALKEILLKKHRKSTPRSGGKINSKVDALVVTPNSVKNEDETKDSSKMNENNTEVTPLATSDNNSMALDTTTKNSILASKKSATKSSKNPQSLTLKQHKLLRAIQQHKSSHNVKTKGYMNPLSKKNVWGDMVKMIASEIVFACTPAYDPEDEQQDEHAMVCTTIHKTCGGSKDVEEEVKQIVVAKDDDTLESKKDVTPKEINIGFMPKFKSTKPQTNSDDNTTFTTAATNSILSKDSKERKKALQERLKELQHGRTQDSYELGTNSIVTRSTSRSGSNASAKENTPKGNVSKSKSSNNNAAMEQLVGKATAESPLLLLSDSVENLILEANKIGGNDDADDILPLLSSSGVESAGSFQNVPKTSKVRSIVQENDATASGNKDDDLTDATDGKVTEDDDTADYQDMEEKMLMQIRLAQQIRKRKQLHKKLASMKQQQQMQEQTLDTRDDVVEARDPLVTKPTATKEDRNPSGHTHLTMATAKHTNTTADDKFNADAGMVDSAVYFPKDDNAEREYPLDAEELYQSTYRKEKRRKDLEEMKQILSCRNNASICSSSYNYGWSDDGGTPTGQNVFDLQRAQNFATLKSLRQYHLDVVRLQLREEDENYNGRMM
jgi:hypothetical protein